MLNEGICEALGGGGVARGVELRDCELLMILYASPFAEPVLP